MAELEENVIEDEPIEDEVIEDELDADGNPVKKEEPWQKEDNLEPGDVPVGTHIRMKQKYKGRIKDRDEENERLRAENEEFKRVQSAQNAPAADPVRPKQDDFDTDEEYTGAWEKYQDDVAQTRYDRLDRQRSLRTSQDGMVAARDKAVDVHYDRVDKLLTDSGISPEVYKSADQKVRESVEAIVPKQGDLITDQMIAHLGDGSEKVIYYLGRNKGALGEFERLLVKDPSGIRAAVFLGTQKERLSGTPKKMKSTASPPASEIRGDANTGTKGRAFKNRYDAAHGKGNIQAAYNAKKEAKAAGVNTKEW
jgi:hypothetical protein